MELIRVVARRHLSTALTGQGAAIAGGRWNCKGTPVVYTSESIAAAMLEVLVHLDLALAPPDLVYLRLQLPEGAPIETVEVSDLPSDWRRYPAPIELARIGDDWARRGSTLALNVPSAVVPTGRNILLNPAHPDMVAVRRAAAHPLILDPRLAP